MRAERAVGHRSRQLVVFALGPGEYGVPIAMVQEIIRHIAPRPIPDAPAHVLGVINLRGRIIPVFDLRARLGVVADPPEEARIVVMETGETIAGAVVDDVREVLTVETARCAVPGPDAAQADPIDAVATLEGRTLVILDTPRLLAEVA
jgi:purine-binding chemotaxis protein CheW